MSFTTEIVLDCIKAMIFIDVVYHPTELIYILALISRIISDNVQMLVSWLSRHCAAIFLIIKVSESEVCKIMKNALSGKDVHKTCAKKCEPDEIKAMSHLFIRLVQVI